MILILLLILSKLRAKAPRSNQRLWSDVKHYKPSHFDSRDAPGSGSNMHIELVYILDQLANRFGFRPINSGYRTSAHNAAVGGSPTSSHVKGLAVDIPIYGLDDMAKVVAFLKFIRPDIRIGQYHTKRGNYFIHVDIDSSKPVIWWAYTDWGGQNKKTQLFIKR